MLMIIAHISHRRMFKDTASGTESTISESKLPRRAIHGLTEDETRESGKKHQPETNTSSLCSWHKPFSRTCANRKLMSHLDLTIPPGSLATSRIMQMGDDFNHQHRSDSVTQEKSLSTISTSSKLQKATPSQSSSSGMP